MRMEDICGLAADPCPTSSQEAVAISEAHIPRPVCIQNSFQAKCWSNAFLADNNLSCQLLRNCNSQPVAGGLGVKCFFTCLCFANFTDICRCFWSC